MFDIISLILYPESLNPSSDLQKGKNLPEELFLHFFGILKDEGHKELHEKVVKIYFLF